MFKLFSQIDPLMSAIVHTPGQEIERLVPWYIEHPLTFDVEYTRQLQTLQTEHLAIVQILEREIGTDNVYQVSDLLREVFEFHAAKRIEILNFILGESVAEQYRTALRRFDNEEIEMRLSQDIADDLIVGYPRHWLQDESNEIVTPIILPKDGLRHVRDSVSVLPSGVILGAIQRLRRRGDMSIMRAIFKYHPKLNSEITLDFGQGRHQLEESHKYFSPVGLSVEGGNIQVLSSDSIAIGVPHAWSNADYDTQRFYLEQAISQIFETDPLRQIQRVYAVHIPNIQHFWHLDSVFNMIGPKAAVAMPYIWAGSSSKDNPLIKFVRRIADDLKLSAHFPLYPYNIPTADDLEYMGKTEIYDREDFEHGRRVIPVNRPTQGFLDCLSEHGILDLNKVVWAGGDPSNFHSPFEHLRVALREQASQACNLFVIRPFHPIAFDQNPLTNNALREFLTKHGGRLEIVPGGEAAKSEGGPHCLVLDINRQKCF